jgi:hypothetical protein
MLLKDPGQTMGHAQAFKKTLFTAFQLNESK